MKNPWTPPVQITTINSPNFYEIPQLLVGNTGTAAVIWRNNTILEGFDTILINKFDPSLGWLGEPEIVAVFLPYLNGRVYNAILSENGKIIIAWMNMGDEFIGEPSSFSLTRGNL